jgi:hypothetical protein
MTDQDRAFHRFLRAVALQAASGWLPRV